MNQAELKEIVDNAIKTFEDENGIIVTDFEYRKTSKSDGYTTRWSTPLYSLNFISKKI